jgi:magnesium chelatase family protein
MTVVAYAPGGFHGHVVAVEVDCRTGIPGTDVVGLPGNEVREARDRVRVAIRNSGFSYPMCRILVNLSPADVPKTGNGFDLAIAAAILISSGQIDAPGEPFLLLGELHLDGRVGGVRGVLAAVDEARARGVNRAVVPADNYEEARAVSTGVVALSGLSDLPRALCAQPDDAPPSGDAARGSGTVDGDYANLRGNAVMKRLLEIAAAGAHHCLVVGPPGAGKSMAIGLLPTILPMLRREEAVEVTRLQSLAGELDRSSGLVWARPFRAPHHNSSAAGLLGGGRAVAPGEVSLAHRGVLFLDEALEFGRRALQSLREPLERRRVLLSRAGRRYWFPAAFQLALASNPCPCGQLGRSDRRCLCSQSEVDRYWRRLGAPLLDRIDLRLSVRARPISELPRTESSSAMRARVERAVGAQEARAAFAGTNRNGTLGVSTLESVCSLSRDARRGLVLATRSIGLSSRASVSILKVSRTIADLEGDETVGESHLFEAVQHRRRGEDQPIWE